MFYRILVTADGSTHDDKAMNAAIELAQNHPDSVIIGLSMIKPMPADSWLTGTDMVDYELHEHALAQSRIDRLAELAKSAGVACETVIESSLRAPEDIAHVAIRHKCNCIFMTSLSSNRSSSWKTLAEASIPVIIYR